MIQTVFGREEDDLRERRKKPVPQEPTLMGEEPLILLNLDVDRCVEGSLGSTLRAR